MLTTLIFLTNLSRCSVRLHVTLLMTLDVILMRYPSPYAPTVDVMTGRSALWFSDSGDSGQKLQEYPVLRPNNQ